MTFNTTIFSVKGNIPDILESTATAVCHAADLRSQKANHPFRQETVAKKNTSVHLGILHRKRKTARVSKRTAFAVKVSPDLCA
jgi:hypothetical protein